MGLDKQEEELKKKIEKLGLKRIIRHLRFKQILGRCPDIDVKLGKKKKYKNVRAITVSSLVEDESLTYQDISSLEDSKEMYEKLVKRGISFDYSSEVDVISKGLAICKKPDHFNKQLGRVIATGRALKRIETKRMTEILLKF